MIKKKHCIGCENSCSYAELIDGFVDWLVSKVLSFIDESLKNTHIALGLKIFTLMLLN